MSYKPLGRAVGEALVAAVATWLVVAAGDSIAQEPLAPTTELEGTWLIRRATADELSLRLTIARRPGEGGATSAQIDRVGRVGRWQGGPPGVDASDEPVAVATALGADGSLRLRSGAWSSSLWPVAEGIAVVVVAGADEIGIAYRTRPLPDEVVGDWARVEPHPAGPRSQALRVGDDAVTLFDGAGRATVVPAVGLPPNGERLRLAMLPDRGSARAVELSSFDGGYVVLEVGGDELAIVHATGASPPWIDAEPLAQGETYTGELDGRWLVGRAERARLPVELSIALPIEPRIELGSGMAPASRPEITVSRLGPGLEVPAELARLPGPDAPLVLITGELGERETRRLWTDAQGGALWPSDEASYERLWRVAAVDTDLIGSWARIGADGSDVTAVIGPTELVLGDGEPIPLVGVVAGDGAFGLVVLDEDRSGRLIRLWPLPGGELVEVDGTIWRRGER